MSLFFLHKNWHLCLVWKTIDFPKSFNGIDSAIEVLILDEAISVLIRANSSNKSMALSFLSPAICKKWNKKLKIKKKQTLNSKSAGNNHVPKK